MNDEKQQPIAFDDDGLVFHTGLVCHVRQALYDFEKRKGRLVLGQSNSCTDMGGAIKLFQAIDERVTLVETFRPNGSRDTYYKKGKDGEWIALDP